MKTKKSTIKEIEKIYGVDFGVRGNMKIGTYLRRMGIPSLAKALDKFTK
jgi:hypothetical protein